MNPRLLERVQCPVVRCQSLYRQYFFALCHADWCDTAGDRLVVDVHQAGTALSDAAAEMSSSYPEMVSQNIQ